jgi:hypothetical protein
VAITITRALPGFVAIAALIAIESRSSIAETYRPWCVEYSGRDGARTCIFSSFEQCMMTATPGTGGQCIRNPWYLRYGERGARQSDTGRVRPKHQ